MCIAEPIRQNFDFYAYEPVFVYNYIIFILLFPSLAYSGINLKALGRFSWQKGNLPAVQISVSYL